MAQGVAWAARELGVPATVIAPDSAPQTKLDAIARLGGTVVKVPYERWWEIMLTSRFDDSGARIDSTVHIIARMANRASDGRTSSAGARAGRRP